MSDSYISGFQISGSDNDGTLDLTVTRQNTFASAALSSTTLSVAQALDLIDEEASGADEIINYLDSLATAQEVNNALEKIAQLTEISSLIESGASVEEIRSAILAIDYNVLELPINSNLVTVNADEGTLDIDWLPVITPSIPAPSVQNIGLTASHSSSTVSPVSNAPSSSSSAATLNISPDSLSGGTINIDGEVVDLSSLGTDPIVTTSAIDATQSISGTSGSTLTFASGASVETNYGEIISTGTINIDHTSQTQIVFDGEITGVIPTVDVYPPNIITLVPRSDLSETDNKILHLNVATDRVDVGLDNSAEGLKSSLVSTAYQYDPSKKPSIGFYEDVSNSNVLARTHFLQFDGVDDILHINDNDALNSGSDYDARTISILFKANDVTSRQVIYEEGGSWNGLNIYIDQGKLYFGAWSETQGWSFTSVSQTISANQVLHATLVLDGLAGTLSGYIDGQRVGQVNDAGILNRHSADIGLGGQIQGSHFHDGEDTSWEANHFNGQLYEFIMYSDAKNDSQVNNIQRYMETYGQPEAKTLSSFYSEEISHFSADHLVDDNSDNTVEALTDVGMIGNDAYQNYVAKQPLLTNDAIGSARALVFDGVNDMMRIDNHHAINTLNSYDARSIGVVFSADNVTGRQVIYEEGGKANGLNIYIDQGKLYFGAWSKTQGWEFTSVSHDIAANQGYHAMLVLDGVAGTLTGYVNGIEIGQVSNAGLLAQHKAAIGLGAQLQGSHYHDGEDTSSEAHHFDGAIGEITISSDVKTFSSVQNIVYNAHNFKYELISTDPGLISIPDGGIIFKADEDLGGIQLQDFQVVNEELIPEIVAVTTIDEDISQSGIDDTSLILGEHIPDDYTNTVDIIYDGDAPPIEVLGVFELEEADFNWG